MSVYTKINEEELKNHLNQYSIGSPISLTGISDGIENTNYLLKTDLKEYIFTIFENIDGGNITNYLMFMNHLSERGLLCPNVMKSKKDELFIKIKNKPSAIIEKLSGKSIISTDNTQCSMIGNLLAKFHNCGSDFNIDLKNTRGIEWCTESFKKLSSVITVSQSEIISRAIEMQKDLIAQDLPVGTIHADLFRDNVLFHDNKVSGMIDFYYSCKGYLIYDLAVVVNDWCSDLSGKLIIDKCKNMMISYSGQRNININEFKYWQHALVAGALRFYLSRLLDLHYPKIGEITHIKDPGVFENILIDRLNNKYETVSDTD